MARVDKSMQRPLSDTKIDDDVMREVATWPELTDDELERLALLLRPLALILRDIRRKQIRESGSARVDGGRAA